jgi:hypothetical protein
MTISVSLIHLESDYQGLLSILRLNLPDLPHMKRFRWLYYANLHGLGGLVRERKVGRLDHWGNLAVPDRAGDSHV